MSTGDPRVEFTAAVRKRVAQKAMYICSNPDCLRVTGFVTSKGQALAIAQAAHILAAANKGPRRDEEVRMPDGSLVKRGDEANAIWLCMPCHYRVDSDWEAFPADLLVTWKRDHERRISGLAGLDLEQSLLRLGEVRASHDLSRQLLLWLDGHRFMYFDDSQEQPEYVWRAVDALRVKLVDFRSRVFDSQSTLGLVLADIDTAVRDFVVALNDIRVDKIQVTFGDREFDVFSRALGTLRRQILTAVGPLTSREGFAFENIPSDLLEESHDALEIRSATTSGGKK